MLGANSSGEINEINGLTRTMNESTCREGHPSVNLLLLDEIFRNRARTLRNISKILRINDQWISPFILPNEFLLLTIDQTIGTIVSSYNNNFANLLLVIIKYNVLKINLTEHCPRNNSRATNEMEKDASDIGHGKDRTFSTLRGYPRNIRCRPLSAN